MTVAALSACALLYAGAGNFPPNNRSRDWAAKEYVENVLAAVEPTGPLLTADWQVYAPALYMQFVEGFRREVRVIDVNLLRRSWHFDTIDRTYPGLLASCAGEVETFLRELRQREQDPGAYARDPGRTARIDDLFQALLLAFVRQHARAGGAYVTYDLATGLAEPAFARALSPGVRRSCRRASYSKWRHGGRSPPRAQIP